MAADFRSYRGGFDTPTEPLKTSRKVPLIEAGLHTSRRLVLTIASPSKSLWKIIAKMNSHTMPVQQLVYMFKCEVKLFIDRTRGAELRYMTLEGVVVTLQEASARPT